MKKLIATMMMFTFIISMVMATPTEVKASETSEEICVDGSYLTEDSESSVIVYPTLRGVYLLNGTGTITVPGNGLVGCYGTTAATTTVSKVSVAITLQRYVSGTWVTVTSWSTYAYNTNYISLYKGQSVTGGYYYRVKTTHIAASDWTMGATDGVWVAK